MAEKVLSAKFNPSSINLFSCFIALVLAVIYLFFRLGFNDLHTGHLLEALGVAFFILCLPGFVQNRFRRKNEWYLSDSFLIVGILMLLTCLGLLIAKLPVLGSLKWILVISGYSLFLLLVFRQFMQQNKKYNLIIIALSIVLSIWVAAIFWGYGVFSPLYFESFAVQLPHIDTLFHIAMAQMIKTYGVPAVGFEGVTYLPYHFGSHFLFAQFSFLLGMDMTTFYPLAYPVIFIPLFFKVFLSFIQTVSERLFPENSPGMKGFILFCFVFFWGFVGVASFNYLNKAGAASYAVILSESYSVSLMLLFAFLEGCFRFWHSYKQQEGQAVEKILFAMVVVPLLLIVIGIVKISTLYIALALAGYVFLRLKLFRDPVFIISVLILVSASLYILFAVYRANSGHSGFQYFHYLNTYIHAPLIFFVLLFYWWVLVLALQMAYCYKVSPAVRPAGFAFFALELALVASVAGFVPAIFLKFAGGSANYFMEPQYWIALSLALIYLTPFEKIPDLSTMTRKVAWMSVFIVLCLLMARNYKHHYNLLSYKNLSLRKYMSDKTSNLEIPRKKLLQDVFPPEKPLSENLRNILYQPQQSILKDPEFLFFLNLQKLRSIKDRENTLLFIENKHGLHSAFPCYVIPFAIPALTGMATLHGIPYDYCPATEYGYELFTLEPRTEIGRLNQPEDLCADGNGKKKLIILNYENYRADSLQFFDCERMQFDRSLPNLN